MPYVMGGDAHYMAQPQWSRPGRPSDAERYKPDYDLFLIPQWSRPRTGRVT